MCSEVAPDPTNVFVGRCTTRHNIHVYRSCGGWFGAKRSNRSRKSPYQIFENFSSFSVHFFISSIQLLLFLRSYKSFSCPSSIFMNSLRLSPHLLLGLPACLLVLLLVSSAGCQSTILLVYIFSGRETILRAIRHFNLLCVSIQQGISCFIHMFFGFFGASLDVFDPVFFIFSGVYFFIDLFLKRYVAVLIFL